MILRWPEPVTPHNQRHFQGMAWLNFGVKTDWIDDQQCRVRGLDAGYLLMLHERSQRKQEARGRVGVA